MHPECWEVASAPGRARHGSVRAGGAQGWLRFRHVIRCVTIDMVCPHNGMVFLH